MLTRSGCFEDVPNPSWPFFFDAFGLGTRSSNEGVSSKWGSSSVAPPIRAPGAERTRGDAQAGACVAFGGRR